ncbi:MAG: response regulator transcription factor, partial [Thermomicrobiales bacterium]
PIREQLAGRAPAARLSTAELRERAAAAEVGGSPLTPRETEVLAAAGRGLSNKEIARALGCSDQTVKNHLTAIMRKTETGDRTQAVLLGLRRGWIAIEPAASGDGT